ncbi:hypothetical protein T4D_6445 [Trichinella pseudospiralis]|uniref:Uncharacterized protein n=1 Tax=Trichinella pseudospiralis TaxID=6337 RepID=A0A0V1F2V0_TRIPS|nr:hypothetical protein T4D_6445 [Trichinella pseudospiralis]
MTIYGKVLCHQPATSTFNEGFSNGSRRSFINTGFLYYCPCHMFKSPAAAGVAPGYASGHIKICICLRATPLAFYCTIFAPRLCRNLHMQIFLCPEARPRALPEAIFQKFVKFSNF